MNSSFDWNKERLIQEDLYNVTHEENELQKLMPKDVYIEFREERTDDAYYAFYEIKNRKSLGVVEQVYLFRVSYRYHSEIDNKLQETSCRLSALRLVPEGLIRFGIEAKIQDNARKQIEYFNRRENEI